MSEPKFTPGPWSAADEPDPIGKRYVIHSVPTATGVAHCWTKADARLIAAAPVLYAAVEAALERFDDEIHCRPPRRHALKYAQDLRDALAKAVAS